jgi:transcriptional regulator with XRE-family HTH domain
MPARPKDQDSIAAFAEELKAWRAARGWTQGDLAAQVNYSESLIALVETCRAVPSMDLGRALDRLFATPGYAPAKDGSPEKPGTFMRIAVRIRKLSFPASFRLFSDAEEEATALYIFEHGLFPGLFQTEQYARTLVSMHPGVTEEQAAERLTARMSRQAIITRDNPPRVWVLLYELVLRNQVNSPQAMYDQIMRLVAVSRLPNVTVQVLPAGMHVAMQGSFHIAEVDGVSTATFIADAADGHTTQDPATLVHLSERFRYLQIEALTPSASREFMEKVASDTWSQA